MEKIYYFVLASGIKVQQNTVCVCNITKSEKMLIVIVDGMPFHYIRMNINGQSQLIRTK